MNYRVTPRFTFTGLAALGRTRTPPDSAIVSKPVSIDVALIGVRNVGAVVGICANTIAIGVITRIREARVARIAETVGVAIRLVRVVDRRTVIA